MQLVQKSFSLSIVIAVLLGMVFLTTVSSSAQAHTLVLVSPSPTSNWSTLVSKADPYVHITSNTATIDPQIQTVLSADEIALVKDAVNHYNKLPLTTRQHPSATGTSTVNTNSTQEGVTIRATALQWRYDTYWWGVRLWISSGIAQDLGILGGVVGGAIGGAIGTALGAAPGAVIGAIIGGITGSTTALLDNNCGNQGVFIDINWALSVTAKPVC